jgi:hypothetical protein
MLDQLGQFALAAQQRWLIPGHHRKFGNTHRLPLILRMR